MKCIKFFIIICLSASANEAMEFLCERSDAQQSCGQCIKTHSDCAWCIDPHFSSKNRCQLKTRFTNETCLSNLVYSPQATEIKLQQICSLQNLPLETKQHDGKTTVRLQPQAVSVRLMPGHSASIDFKYMHRIDSSYKNIDSELMEIQTSDFRNSPLKLKTFISCDGGLKEGKSCRALNNQTIEFKVELSVDACSSTGDITLSIGVLGQRTIAGIYVTTICGCECEKHPEMKSRLCHQNGHLVCGQCICDSNRAGDQCECPLLAHGVETASLLENKCKLNSSSPVCNNNGKCKCGECQCFKPSITGKFCECDNNSCPNSTDGKMCSSNGVCKCGFCKCEIGWKGRDCSCPGHDSKCTEHENESGSMFIEGAEKHNLSDSVLSSPPETSPAPTFVDSTVVLNNAVFCNWKRMLNFTTIFVVLLFAR